MKNAEEALVLAAAFAGVAVLVPRAINSAQATYYSYGDKHVARIDAIRNAYIACCYNEEKDSPNLSTLEKPEDPYPVYFAMDTVHSKIPKFFSLGLKPNLNQFYWKKKLNRKSGLRTAIQDIIGYICEYQNARDEYISYGVMEKIEKFKDSISSKIRGDAAYFYDPVNLFCEELKRWLVGLSNVSLDESAKKQVSARLGFLNTIYVGSKIFAEQNSQTPFIPIVEHLKNLFEEELIKRIDLAISQKGAREYFESMKLEMEALLFEGAEFLFYLFKDGTDDATPKNFVLSQVKSPTLLKYKAGLDNISGQLLQYLVNKTAFAQVFPAKTESGKEIDDRSLSIVDVQSSKSYQFIADNGTTIFPLTNEQLSLTKYNWFLLESKEEKWSKKDLEILNIKSGILPIFREKDLMQRFLLLHGYLEKLSVFYMICDTVYELTGDVGNLMLYGFAASNMISILNVYESLINGVISTLAALKSAAEKLYNKYHGREISGSSANKCWTEICFSHVSVTYDDIRKHIEQSLKIKSDIAKLIVAVNHPNYSAIVKKKMSFLLQCVDLFVKGIDPQQAKEISSLQQNRYVMLPNVSSHIEPKNRALPNAEKASSEKNEVEDPLDIAFNGAYHLYTNEQYKEFMCISELIMRTEKRPDAILDLLILQVSVLQKFKEYEKSLQAIDKALPLSSKLENPRGMQYKESILLAKANILYFLKDNDGAEKTIKDLLELNQSNQEALQLRDKLQERLQSSSEKTLAI